MAFDPYDVDGAQPPVSDDEITTVHALPHAPDGRVQARDLTYHQGADYGEADATVTVVDGCQCVYGGVIRYGGETLRVPQTLAEYLLRSGWATAEPDSEADEPEPDSEAEPPRAPATAKASARQVSAGSGRRKR